MKDFWDIFLEIYKCKVYGIVSHLQVNMGTQIICSNVGIKTW